MSAGMTHHARMTRDKGMTHDTGMTQDVGMTHVAGGRCEECDQARAARRGCGHAVRDDS